MTWIKNGFQVWLHTSRTIGSTETNNTAYESISTQILWARRTRAWPFQGGATPNSCTSRLIYNDFAWWMPHILGLTKNRCNSWKLYWHQMLFQPMYLICPQPHTSKVLLNHPKKYIEFHIKHTMGNSRNMNRSSIFWYAHCIQNGIRDEKFSCSPCMEISTRWSLRSKENL